MYILLKEHYHYHPHQQRIIHTQNQLINGPLFYPPATVRTWREHDPPLEERLQCLHQVLATPTYTDEDE
jgi:hypothetical protein